MKLALHVGLHRRQYVTVNVIEEVERGQDGKGQGGMSARPHCWREDSTEAGQGRLYQSAFFLGRGQRASTIVLMPPRALKSPFTTAHTGLAARTRSSSTRLTTFSWKIWCAQPNR